MNADCTLLTDIHRALLVPLLPGRVGRRGVVAKDNRGFVEPCAGGGARASLGGTCPRIWGSGTGCSCVSAAGVPAVCRPGRGPRCRLPAKRCPARGSGRCSSTRPPCGPTSTGPVTGRPVGFCPDGRPSRQCPASGRLARPLAGSGPVGAGRHGLRFGRLARPNSRSWCGGHDSAAPQPFAAAPSGPACLPRPQPGRAAHQSPQAAPLNCHPL